MLCLWRELKSEIRALKEKNLYRSLTAVSAGRSPAMAGRLLDFSSNDYLGFSTHPSVVKKAAEALRFWGAGSGASRLISGNLQIHMDLEKALARFKKEETAAVFSSGYLANLGAVTALLGEEDVVLIDRLNHASLVDAARLSKAKLWVYPHRDVQALEQLLARAGRFRRRLVATDAYFSMDGDVAPLDRLLEVCEQRDAILMIDEAHSTGVFGATGRGLTEHFGLSGKIPIVMGTLSKALGSVGGFVCGNLPLKETLINRCRQFIYTTAPVPAASAAAMESLRMIEEETDTIGLRKTFWDNIHFLRSSLKEFGFDLMESEGPIVPILIGNTKKTLALRDYLRKEGIWAPAIRPPTVPKGASRLRLSVLATHSRSQLMSFVRIMKKAKERLR